MLIRDMNGQEKEVLMGLKMWKMEAALVTRF
jgi:hypothetical protein